MTDSSQVLRLDATTCDGIGMCAFVAPALISVDAWGYPVPVTRPLAGGELRRARAAVSACPRRALFLDRPRAQRTAPAGAAGRGSVS